MIPVLSLSAFSFNHYCTELYRWCIPFMAEKNGYFHALWMCVFVCQRKRAAGCQRGGVKRPRGFEHSRPARLTVCLDNGIFTSTSPSLHPSIAPPHYLGGKSLRIEGSPSSPPSTSVSPCPFSLSLSLRCRYQPSSLLPHSSHWGVSTHLPSCGATPPPSISDWSPLGGWAGILLTFSLNCLPHSATFYLFLSTCDTLYSRLLGWHCPHRYLLFFFS